MQTAVAEKPGTMSLAVLEPEKIKSDLAISSPAGIQLDETKLDKASVNSADALVSQIMDINPLDAGHVEVQDQAKIAVACLGERTQREAARLSNSPMLKKSVATLAKTEDGGTVATSLVALNSQVLELDPSGIDFSKPGGLKRFLSPFMPDRLKTYFARFEQADALIEQIVQSLINGRGELTRDNLMLLESQKKMRMMTIQLEKAIMLGLYLDKKFEYLVEMELPDGDLKKKFIAEELMFPLRQRIGDLQQQLAVNQQGVLVFEIIMRNNRELINGVRRAELVTVTALNVAVAAALALGNQKVVLKTLENVNATTDGLIAGTAERLKTQGVDIHKQASASAINIETLKKAFEDIKQAIDDISTYRAEALPRMKENIAAMQELTGAAAEAISRMESGNAMAPNIALDVASVNS